jgi:hypothetical protein
MHTQARSSNLHEIVTSTTCYSTTVLVMLEQA